jgi:hypothetical protein
MIVIFAFEVAAHSNHHQLQLSNAAVTQYPKDREISFPVTSEQDLQLHSHSITNIIAMCQFMQPIGPGLLFKVYLRCLVVR